MSARAVEQVERWANELIDLSKRNTSLNYKPNDPAAKRQSRTALAFLAPRPDRILQLVQAGKRLDVYLPPGNEQALDPDRPSRPASPQADMLVTDRRTAKDVEYTLRELSRRAEADRNDKGLHSLYLCFGMLVWREAEDAEWMRSPLVFTPMEIIRGSVREPYRLTRAEGDTVLNPSLRVLLERDFNVALPDIEPELPGTQGLLQALDATRAALHDPARKVRDDVVLKRATFAKEAMYRDLLDNLEQVASHPLIEALADPTSLPSDGEPEPPGEDRMDEVAPPERARLILDADGSQRRAVHAAVQGSSFVMDGPPGSGKSQTIANVIAELIAAGKSVLFVSEKVAALDVVAMRLRRHGLGDFLLDLHGNDVTRKQVAAELGRALRTHPIAHPRLGAAQLEQARRLRVALSAYASAVNIVRAPLGRTVHWVLGRLAQLDHLPIAPRPAGIGEALTAAAAAELLDRFEDLARVWAPVETPEHFHWLGLVGDPTGPAARDELQRLLASLQDGLNEVEELAGELVYAAGFAPPSHLSEAERVASVLDHCRHQPRTEPGWWSHPDLGAVEGRVLELRSMSSRRQKAIEGLRARYGERWLDLPTNGAEQLAGSLALLQSLRPALTGEHLARDRAALVVDFANATAELAAELPAESAYLAAALQAGERDRTVTEIFRLAGVGEQADAVLRPEPRWASTLVAAQVEQTLRTLQPLLYDYRRRRLALGEVFDDGVYSLDLQGLVTRFEQVHTGMGKLGSFYRADKRQVAAVARTGKASADVRGYLREALAVHHLGVAIDEQERASHELLGRFFSPRTTDVDAAMRVLQLLRFAAQELGADYNPAGVAAQLAGPGPADPRLAARSQHLRQRLQRWYERSIDVLGEDRGLTELTPAELVTWASTARGALMAGAEVLAAAGELRGVPGGVEDILAELRMRADLAVVEAELAERAVEDGILLGDRYTGFTSPWEELLTGIRWTIELQGRHGAPLGPAATARMRNSPAIPDPAPLAERLELVRKMIGQLAAQFEPARATDLNEELGGRFSDAQEQVTLLVDHLDQIEVWQAYMARSSALRADGWSAALDFCVDRKMPAGELAEVLERAMYAAWYDAVSMGDPTLRGIRADELEAKVAQFRDLDRQLVRDAAEHVVQACVARKPTTTVGPARIIDHQAQLKSRHMPVRRLLEQTAEVVTALKPCFMMSPLSVSQFLPAGFVFDTVIFDEASQITPADAANCIYRGRQLIVAGDDRQLPPTSFFQSGGSDTDSDEYEEGQFDEFESVLKLAKGTARLPSLPLRWHYRSKHESLITFRRRLTPSGRLVCCTRHVDDPTRGLRPYPECRCRNASVRSLKAWTFS
jgi:Protein of unknown function (DUF4011)/AAA domain